MTDAEINLLLAPIAKAADALEDWLGKNVGDNADWPLKISGPPDGADKVCELLTELHRALKPYRLALSEQS